MSPRSLESTSVSVVELPHRDESTPERRADAGIVADESNLDEKPMEPEEMMMLESQFLAIEKGFAKLGRQIEEAIDNSPIGVKLPDQQRFEQTPHTARRSPEKPQRSSKAISPKEVAAAAKKGAVAVGGGALIGVGVVMIPTLPPPFATLTMLGGYAVLGTEFEGPRKVVRGAREKLTKALDEENENGEGEAKNEAADNDWEKVGDGSTKKETEKKGARFKKVAKSFGKSVVLPALDKVCTAYEKFEDEKESLDKNLAPDDCADAGEEIIPSADEAVVENEEATVENEENQAEDSFFDANQERQADENTRRDSWSDVGEDGNEEAQADKVAKTDSWSDVEEDEGKEELLANSNKDNDWDDAVVISHFDD